MELKYTYTEEPDGWFVGRLEVYPECPTQGKTLAELEMMLAEVYTLMKEEEQRFAEIERQRQARQHTGVIKINVEVPA
jgi:predicted RNase H-like HicB family nuclease